MSLNFHTDVLWNKSSISTQQALDRHFQSLNSCLLVQRNFLDCLCNDSLSSDSSVLSSWNFYYWAVIPFGLDHYFSNFFSFNSHLFAALLYSLGDFFDFLTAALSSSFSAIIFLIFKWFSYSLNKHIIYKLLYKVYCYINIYKVQTGSIWIYTLNTFIYIYISIFVSWIQCLFLFFYD